MVRPSSVLAGEAAEAGRRRAISASPRNPQWKLTSTASSTEQFAGHDVPAYRRCRSSVQNALRSALGPVGGHRAAYLAGLAYPLPADSRPPPRPTRVQ